MIAIKQIKSDISGPILFQGVSNIQRSTDFIWNDNLKELQINGSVAFLNSTNAFKISLIAGATASDITYRLPIINPTFGQALVASAPVSGVSTLAWTTLSNTPGVIKIHDPLGEFFTSLATATAYIRTFYPVGSLTDQSFKDKVYRFTVPAGSDFSSVSHFLADGSLGAPRNASITDEFGLIAIFLDYAFVGSTGNNTLGDCTFGGAAFASSSGNNTLGNCTFEEAAFAGSTGNNILGDCTFSIDALVSSTGNNILGNCTFSANVLASSTGNNTLGDCIFGSDALFESSGTSILGDCTFGQNALFFSSGIYTIKNILLDNVNNLFGQMSRGRFYLNGTIGTDTAGQYANFFLNSTAEIRARRAAFTNNAGGVEGDLATATANGASVFFGVSSAGGSNGLIKIHDPLGEFFTSLATATAYIRTFYPVGSLTDQSFKDKVYRFTVPDGSDFSSVGHFLADGSLGAPRNASITDEFGLIAIFLDYAFLESTGNHTLGDCTFGAEAFNSSKGNNTVGNCTFGGGAFSSSAGNNTIGDCTFGDSALRTSTGDNTLGDCTFGTLAFHQSTGNNTLGNCTFVNSAFRGSAGNNTIGDCTFGDSALYVSTGNNTLGDCTFGDGAFFESTGICSIKNILLSNVNNTFAENSTGRFYLNGTIGTSTAGQYANFFLTSTAEIRARRAALTNNAGGIEGDLATATANGASVFFGVSVTSSQTLAQTLANGNSTNSVPITSPNTLHSLVVNNSYAALVYDSGFIYGDVRINSVFLRLLHPTAIEINAPIVTKNGLEIATENYVNTQGFISLSAVTDTLVTSKLLTGLNITGGSVMGTDSILTAFGKLQNQISAALSGVNYQGVWNANTNSPAIASSIGVKGYYYVVSVAGLTSIDGITDWQVGDWIIFNGITWNKVDNTDAVSSVNGQVGAVSLTTDNISDFLNKRYVTDTHLTILGNTGGTNTGDNAANSLYSGLVSNATHTGDVTGATALTLATVNVNTGTFNSVTVNAKGLVTAASNVTYGDMVLATAQTNTGVKTFLNLSLGLRNVLNTFTSFFTNSNTASRTYTLPDVSGTIALTSNITGTNSGTNTGDNAVNSLYSGLVSNAAHTGDATGATALTVVAIRNRPFPALGILQNNQYPRYNHATTAFVMTSINLNTILGVLPARAGLIPFANGTANTITSDLAFTYNSANKKLSVIAADALTKLHVRNTGGLPTVFLENFDSVIPNALPASVLNATDDWLTDYAVNFLTNTVTYTSGVHLLVAVNVNVGTQEITFGPINATAFSNLKMSWNGYRQTNAPVLSLSFSTIAGGLGAYTAISFTDVVTNDTWQAVPQFNLPAGADNAASLFIKFSYTSTTTGEFLLFDDIRITGDNASMNIEPVAIFDDGNFYGNTINMGQSGMPGVNARIDSSGFVISTLGMSGVSGFPIQGSKISLVSNTTIDLIAPITAARFIQIESSTLLKSQLNLPDGNILTAPIQGDIYAHSNRLRHFTNSVLETFAYLSDIVGGIVRSMNIGQTGSVTAGAAASTDYVYIFTAAGTLTLPTAVGNTNIYTVKNATGVNITVVFTSGQNADGSTTITLTPNQSLNFISNNTNYHII